MCVVEDCYGGVFVCIEALCACSHVEVSSHWEEHGVALPFFGDCFSIVKILLDAPEKLNFLNGVGIEASVSRLV